MELGEKMQIQSLNLINYIKAEFDNLLKSDFNGFDSNTIELKKQAFQIFESRGLPTLKNEHWKYTNIQFLNKIEFSKTDVITNLNFEEFKGLTNQDVDCHNLFFINGKFIEHISDNSISNLTISILKETPNEYLNQSQIEKNYDSSVFNAINTILYDEVILLKIKKNSAIDKPIHLLNFSVTGETNLLCNPRFIIDVEDNSEVTFLHSNFTFGDGEVLTNRVIEIFVGKNSKVNHIKIQNDLDRTNYIDFFQVNQSRDSYFADFTFTLNGKFVRNNIHSELKDVNCESHFYGVFIGDKNNLIDNHTLVDHAKPNCFSNENYRGVLFEKSTGVFNGKILVRKDAQKTNAYQSNKNILVSKDATINTKPELEIYADDVKCSHGATSGSLDKNSIFYLKVRGIDDLKAEAMLLNAFVSEIVNEIPQNDIKNYINRIVRKKLNDDLHFMDNDDIIE